MNIPDIELVIVYGAPGSVSQFYQVYMNTVAFLPLVEQYMVGESEWGVVLVTRLSPISLHIQSSLASKD